MTAGTTAFFQAYLFAFIFWAGLPLGALFFVMIHPLVGGSWGFAIRPALLSSVRTLPLIALLFVPLAFGLGHLYPWANPHAPHLESPGNAFLTRPFFLTRAIIYFSLWTCLGLLVVRWTERFWKNGSNAPNRLRTLAAGGIALHFVVDTLAAIDWVMSLEPEFFSTAFGFIFMAGQALVALAFVLIVTAWVNEGTYLKERRLAWRDLGSLLATCVLLWAYVEYAQLIISWSGDMKREATWYIHRSRGGWQEIAGALVVLNFAAPFFVLLFRRMKEVPRYLASVGLALVIMHAVEVYWLVVPSFTSLIHWRWLDIATWAGMGVIWLTAFGWTLPRPEASI